MDVPPGSGARAGIGSGVRILKSIAEYHDVGAARIRTEILHSNAPAVLRGAVRDWPAVTRRDARDFCAYLQGFDRGGPVMSFVAAPSAEGRFWYRDDMRGLNFEKLTEPLSACLARILAQLDSPAPQAVYAGSVPIPEILPGFERENPLDILTSPAVPRIWIGNAVTVSTHFDMSHNIACVAAGRRRFTLFPPEQVSNLYVGPLEYNFAGQPVSMVPLKNPDLVRYPRFRAALDTAVQAELRPGDAIFIPYMWWHHVESLEPFNVLVNYWWDDDPQWQGVPFEAMVHALLAIGNLPPEKRRIWRTWFDHYAFRPTGEHPAGHLLPEQRGILGTPTPQLAQFIKSFLIRRLSQ